MPSSLGHRQCLPRTEGLDISPYSHCTLYSCTLSDDCTEEKRGEMVVIWREFSSWGFHKCVSLIHLKFQTRIFIIIKQQKLFPFFHKTTLVNVISGSTISVSRVMSWTLQVILIQLQHRHWCKWFWSSYKSCETSGQWWYHITWLQDTAERGEGWEYLGDCSLQHS